MKLAILALATSLIVAGSAVAQHGRGVSSRGVSARTYGSPSGFGNILFPGTGSPPPIHNPQLGRGTTFAQRLGATVGGFAGYAGAGRRPQLPVSGQRNRLVVPYAVPVYVGGYGYAYSPPQQPHVTVVNQPPPSPSVIINQYYTPNNPEPVVRDYTNTPLPEPGSPVLRSYQAPTPSQPASEQTVEQDYAGEAKPTVYLIVYKDHSIYPAIGYWIEEDTLHYITTQGAHNRASVELIDREFSEQLNRERNVDFKLAIAE